MAPSADSNVLVRCNHPAHGPVNAEAVSAAIPPPDRTYVRLLHAIARTKAATAHHRPAHSPMPEFRQPNRTPTIRADNPPPQDLR